jgi:hypothetical protein
LLSNQSNNVGIGRRGGWTWFAMIALLTGVTDAVRQVGTADLLGRPSLCPM